MIGKISLKPSRRNASDWAVSLEHLSRWEMLTVQNPVGIPWRSGRQEVARYRP